METVSKSARKEILAAVRVRYEQASKLEKGKDFNEAGYHRKHAIRLLNPRPEVGVKSVMEGARSYGAAVKAALVLGEQRGELGDDGGWPVVVRGCAGVGWRPARRIISFEAVRQIDRVRL